MAEEWGVRAASVSRHWRAHGLKPHWVHGFKVSRDPQCVEKLEEIVGLYLAPPEHARGLCYAAKSPGAGAGSYAAWCAAEEGPCRPDDTRRQAPWHDHAVRRAHRARRAGHRPGPAAPPPCREWLTCLRQIARETLTDKTLPLSADSYATHKHPTVPKGWGKPPRFSMHCTPTAAAWLHMVERFFRDLTTERLHRGVLTSVPALVAAIDAYVAHHHTHPQPCIWTKSARDILQKVIRANQRLSSKQNATLH